MWGSLGGGRLGQAGQRALGGCAGGDEDGAAEQSRFVVLQRLWWRLGGGGEGALWERRSFVDRKLCFVFQPYFQGLKRLAELTQCRWNDHDHDDQQTTKLRPAVDSNSV